MSSVAKKKRFKQLSKEYKFLKKKYKNLRVLLKSSCDATRALQIQKDYQLGLRRQMEGEIAILKDRLWNVMKNRFVDEIATICAQQLTEEDGGDECRRKHFFAKLYL